MMQLIHSITQKIVPLLIVLSTSLYLFADGSKDLYPTGAKGWRASIYTGEKHPDSYPFPTKGTHYVYAEEGEVITLASSALGIEKGKIELTKEDGTTLTWNDNTDGGLITNRNEELAGPALESNSNEGYEPVRFEVNKTGVYKVQFWSPTTDDPKYQIEADKDWDQSHKLAKGSLLAWDISVIKSPNETPSFVNGRVWSNVLNLSMGNHNMDDKKEYLASFYGVFYVLTNDGYIYRVDNNGNNGVWFEFFVNSTGFLNKTTKESVYKSLKDSKRSYIKHRVKYPTTVDNSRGTTHKMFYTLPDENMPEESDGAVPSGSTWIYDKNAVVPNVSNVNITSIDGDPNNTNAAIGVNGGIISFNTDAGAGYTILIDNESVSGWVPAKVLGTATEGANQAVWDGKDGDGNQLLPSESGNNLSISIQLHGGEVHFPYMDMEYNPNGIKLELLDPNDLSNVISDKVYWNDMDISTATNGSSVTNKENLEGVSSSGGAHKWGANGSTTNLNGSYGDKVSIDTWTYTESEPTVSSFNLSIIGINLPVELTNFSVACDDERRTLSWTTASENNSSHFIIESSRDGVNWIQIGERSAAGNSSVVKDYTWMDYNANLGITYYRLVQFDYDGKSTVYGPISSSCEVETSMITVFPNPNNGDFTIKIDSGEPIKNGVLTVTSLTGQIVVKRILNLKAGVATIPIDSSSKMSAGTYIVNIYSDKSSIVPVKMIVH